MSQEIPAANKLEQQLSDKLARKMPGLWVEMVESPRLNHLLEVITSMVQDEVKSIVIEIKAYPENHTLSRYLPEYADGIAARYGILDVNN